MFFLIIVIYRYSEQNSLLITYYARIPLKLYTEMHKREEEQLKDSKNSRADASQFYFFLVPTRKQQLVLSYF